MNVRWLLVMRGTAALTLIVIIGPSLAFSFYQPSFLFSTESLFGFALFSIFWIPYAVILWNSRPSGRTKSEFVKKALALAASWGTFVLFASLLLATHGYSACHRDWLTLAMGSVIGLLQTTLIVGAILCYYSMERAPGDRQILITRILITFFAVLFLAVMIPHVTLSRLAANEASAVESIRTITAAQMALIDDRNKNGFAASLSEMRRSSGSEPAQAFLDDRLASGKKNDYVFALSVGQPQADGRVTKYTLSARPVRYGRCGIRSFFTDETGVIRYTAQDRAATAQDPAMQ